MLVDYSRSFKKQYKKLSKDTKIKFLERLQIYLVDPLHPQLNLHKLHGKFYGLYSINITGDYRAVLDKETPEVSYFVAIGTHSELYS